MDILPQLINLERNVNIPDTVNKHDFDVDCMMTGYMGIEFFGLL